MRRLCPLLFPQLTRLASSLPDAIPHLFIQNSLNQSCDPALQAMVVKQGLSCTDAGKGELVAAYKGLNTIAGFVWPMVWARLYEWFLSGPQPSQPALVQAVVRVLGPVRSNPLPSALSCAWLT